MDCVLTGDLGKVSPPFLALNRSNGWCEGCILGMRHFFDVYDSDQNPVLTVLFPSFLRDITGKLIPPSSEGVRIGVFA